MPFVWIYWRLQNHFYANLKKVQIIICINKNNFVNMNLVWTRYFYYLHGRTTFLLRGHMDYRLVLSALFVYSSQISIHILPALSHLQINIRGKNDLSLWSCNVKFTVHFIHQILHVPTSFYNLRRVHSMQIELKMQKLIHSSFLWFFFPINA